MAGAAGLVPGSIFAAKKAPGEMYTVPEFGNVRLLHMTDCHAQLLPVYFREPNVNIGVGPAFGKAPHLVGNSLLERFDISAGGPLSHACTFLDYESAARQYGKVGGFAHLKTLVNRLREEYGPAKTLLLDGGDTWQGSGTAYWTRGKDMVQACNLLGVDVMTGHWEFTYLDTEVLENVKEFKGDFVAQNIRVKEDALFEGSPAFDDSTGHAFKPYTIKDLGGVRVAVIGQAFPYTPIANPARFIPDWTFGIRDEDMQAIVDQVRENEKPDVVVVISHNGMDVDLKMASIITGVDAILGGHTHDGVPGAIKVKNAGGVTLVTNAGSNGKFLGVLDFDVRNGKVQDYRFRLLPVFSNLLPPDAEMAAYIEQVRAPYREQLNEQLAVADTVLYRRGNFNGTFDQIIVDAMRAQTDAQVALSPGFRWGCTVLPGDPITMDDLLTQTCMTYPETYVREMTGADIKLILEDVCDNLFNEDPYYQQGGDMVRVGGLDYVCDPTEAFGKRISEMTLDNGKKVDAGKKYKVTGWATVGSKSPGPPVWDVVADYLRLQKVAKIDKINTPRLKNVGSNPGLMDYSA
jgi:sulfur-oxidizing protein SoxB